VATYKQIQAFVKKRYGFNPKTCWIAQVKEMCGLSVREAWNRKAALRSVPCPPEKVDAIRSALKHFGMIDPE